MAKRVQSSSSIKTFKMCPRKYYYSYIKEIESLPNIHQIRGNIAHTVLEKFFDIDVSQMNLDNFGQGFTQAMQDLLLQEWGAAKERLDKLNLSEEQTHFYFEETLLMLFNWLDHFSKELQTQEGSFQEQFQKLTPEREKHFISETFKVQGYIDAIENFNNEIRIMDYKTNKSPRLSDHKLQLAIYSLLYHELYGKLPDKVGVYFLRDKPKFIKVDEQLLEFAKQEIQLIHQKTCSEDIKDYPKKKSFLCKWSTGQCEYFDICKKED